MTLKPKLVEGKMSAVAHVYIRNDGEVPLSQWCVREYFADSLGQSRELTLKVNDVVGSTDNICLTAKVNPGSIQDFKLSLSGGDENLPISGLVMFQAKRIAAAQSPSVAGKKASECIVSKELPQNVVLTLPPASGAIAGIVVLISGAIAGVFLVFSLSKFAAHLQVPMGASQWSFSSSIATNLTVLGGLVGSVLASSSVPDVPRLISKQSFVVLGLTFAVLAGLSPILYNFCCKPVGYDSSNEVILFRGWVWLFLAADSLTAWAVCGQLGTLGLLFNEFSRARLISSFIAVCAWVTGGAVAIAFLLYCFRTARFYIQQHPSRGGAQETETAATPETRVHGPSKTPFNVPRWTAL